MTDLLCLQSEIINDILDLPSLNYMILGEKTFLGDNGDDCKPISSSPYNFKNKITLQSMAFLTCCSLVDLPSLAIIKGKLNFISFGHLIYDSNLHLEYIIC